MHRAANAYNLRRKMGKVRTQGSPGTDAEVLGAVKACRSPGSWGLRQSYALHAAFPAHVSQPQVTTLRFLKPPYQVGCHSQTFSHLSRVFLEHRG